MTNPELQQKGSAGTSIVATSEHDSSGLGLREGGGHSESTLRTQNCSTFVGEAGEVYNGSRPPVRISALEAQAAFNSSGAPTSSRLA